MVSILRLVAVVALCACAHARRIPTEDSYQPPQLSLELPREQPAQPFHSPEPSTILRAPIRNEPNYYAVPIPSSDLIAPSIETVWNPNNDPKFYYEVPAALTKEEKPTNAFPKKFNKAIHSKDKPFSSQPKQEFTLQPIDAETYNGKQKELQQIFQKLAKKENLRQIEANKAQQTV